MNTVVTEIPNVKVNAAQEILNISNFAKFAESIRDAMEELINRIPQDSSVRLNVAVVGSGYTVEIEIQTADFHIQESGSGRSPYFALEKCMMNVTEAVNVWSINRKI